MAGKWVARIWLSGRSCGEISKFFVPRESRAKTGERRESSQKKKDANGNQAVRRLNRILSENFRKGDALLTLHFDEPGLARLQGDTAVHQMLLFLRRCAYAYKKAGVTFRYVGMDSEKDEETGDPVRLHCHCVVTGALLSKPEGGDEYRLCGKPLSEIWGYGSVDVQLLRAEDDRTGLAVYLCRQARCLPDEKRWHASRNMRKPKCVDVELHRAAIADYNRHRPKGMPALKLGSDGRLLMPTRCTAMEDGQYLPAIGTHYIRFLMPEARRLRTPKEDWERRKRGGA